MISVRRAILIIDRDQSTRELYQRALQASYQVVADADAQHVASLIHEHGIHALVIEPGPLGSLGWELMAQLRRDPRTSALPIIICTAQDERRRGIGLGAAAYLVKPVLPDALLKTLHEIMPADTPDSAAREPGALR